MTDLELGWLAGIIEGEGCFYIRTIKGSYFGSLEVVNTNSLIIEKIGLILRKLGVQYNVRHRVSSDPKAKSYSQLAVQRVEDLNRLLKLLKPVVECRKDQLEALFELTEIRLVKGRGVKYGQVEQDCYARLKELNKKGRKT